jgi:hypothetical protein
MEMAMRSMETAETAMETDGAVLKVLENLIAFFDEVK